MPVRGLTLLSSKRAEKAWFSLMKGSLISIFYEETQLTFINSLSWKLINTVVFSRPDPLISTDLQKVENLLVGFNWHKRVHNTSCSCGLNKTVMIKMIYIMQLLWVCCLYALRMNSIGSNRFEPIYDSQTWPFFVNVNLNCKTSELIFLEKSLRAVFEGCWKHTLDFYSKRMHLNMYLTNHCILVALNSVSWPQ